MGLSAPQLRIELAAHGVVYKKAEDRQGDTYTGYWLGGAYLGKTMQEAIDELKPGDDIAPLPPGLTI